jgi:hypothetical protein
MKNETKNQMNQARMTDAEIAQFLGIYNEKIKNKKQIKPFAIYGVRKHNILESYGFKIRRDRTGAYNGFGYERLPNAYIYNQEDRPLWRNFAQKISKIQKPATKPKRKTQEEITKSWCNRLVKLTSITYEEALTIALEKEEYKQEQIDELEDRQAERYSPQRQKIINKIERSNPLRPIRDESHASAILSASNRHKNTDYEDKLAEAQELRRMGSIDADISSQDYARGLVQ